MKQWNRRIITGIFVLFGFVFLVSGQAQALLRGDILYTKGVVTQIGSNNQITIKTQATGDEVSFRAKRGIGPNIKEGSTVVIVHKAGSNQANLVRIANR